MSTEKADPTAPFVLGDAALDVSGESNASSVFDGEEYGFYVAKNFFAKKRFPIFPQKGYKPVFLNDLNDGLWSEFNRDVQHYQKYYSHISWFYKLWTIVPTCWFLIMILPDLLWYYDLVFKGVGVICGLIIALAFSLDTYLQRRFLTLKVQPMYDLLIDTYKARFMMHGYNIMFRLEPTVLDGMNSYIQFRRAGAGESSEKPSESLHAGFYMDEDFLGSKPYVLDMTSRYAPPRFLTGVDSDTWKSFAKDLDERSKTPMRYLLGPTIAMCAVVGIFVFALVYSVIVLAAVRHWLLIILLPLSALVNIMRSFRRRHFVENVLAQSMTDLMKEYEPAFSKAGYRAFFELEYIMNYLCVNTYVSFYKANGKYCVEPLDDSTTTV